MFIPLRSSTHLFSFSFHREQILRQYGRVAMAKVPGLLVRRRLFNGPRHCPPSAGGRSNYAILRSGGRLPDRAVHRESQSQRFHIRKVFY